jgi:hypothetical protein
LVLLSVNRGDASWFQRHTVIRKAASGFALPLSSIIEANALPNEAPPSARSVISS